MELEFLNSAIVDLIKKDLVKVPPYPAVASQLGAVMARDDANVEAVARIVAGDQALAATVIAYASSARFGVAGAVTSLKRAILRLGTEELFRIAWAASLGAVAVQPGPLLDLKHLVWRQSVMSAFLCERLAQGRGLSREEAFTCGLLHGFGRTIALGCLEQLLAPLQEAEALPGSEWMDLVEKYENELGLVMAVKWALPEQVSEIISTYRTPELAGVHQGMAELVFASDEVVELFEGGPVVTEEGLVTCRQVGGPSEISKIKSLVPVLPSVVAAFVPESAPSRGATMVQAQAQAQPESQGDPQPQSKLNFKLFLVKAKREIEHHLVSISYDGLVLSGPSGLQVNSLVKLSLHTELEPLTFWATVYSSQELGSGHFEIEAKLFGGDRELQQKWAALAASP